MELLTIYIQLAASHCLTCGVSPAPLSPSPPPALELIDTQIQVPRGARILHRWWQACMDWLSVCLWCQQPFRSSSCLLTLQGREVLMLHVATSPLVTWTHLWWNLPSPTIRWQGVTGRMGKAGPPCVFFSSLHLLFFKMMNRFPSILQKWTMSDFSLKQKKLLSTHGCYHILCGSIHCSYCSTLASGGPLVVVPESCRCGPGRLDSFLAFWHLEVLWARLDLKSSMSPRPLLPFSWKYIERPNIYWEHI